MADDIVLPIPNLVAAQSLFVLSNPSLSRLHDEARTAALKAIKDDGKSIC
jgi:26S proteasome regulatory subunit N7